MHIKSIILDGFKSYGKRTEIKGFDPEFNAITGLNGTGKSNVLDSICFVLGISNLTQVRATSLQDLVYKSGQAGVRQASVTLIFDNKNKAQSPIGFENKDEICITRQVVIGGKNKYLLNGRVVLNNRVQDLFASVKLNINNPNFLIMQGRVTKVLNMKPLEILSMIEEAVGSKMFDQKMLKSMAIFQKKSEKLTEFQTHLNETIKPRLAKLEKDKILFLEFQRISKEIDYLTRIHVSYKYVQLRNYAGQYEKKIDDIQSGISKSKGSISDAENRIKAFIEEIAEMEQLISGQTKNELKEMEQNLKEVETSEAKIAAQRNILANGIKTETKNLKAIEKALNDDSNTHRKRVDGMKSEEQMYNQFQELIEQDTKDFEMAQKNFEAVSCGLEVNDEGQASSLLEQLMKAKEVASEENTTIMQCEMQLKNLQKQLHAKKSEKHKKDTTYVKEKENMEKIERELKNLQHALSQISYEEGGLEQLEYRHGMLRNEIQRLQYELDNTNTYRYDFNYRNPEANFNRNRVKGRVCRLFRVKDPKFCLALETCAGGSLYSVVTDTDVTSKLILEKGELQSRTTMIPLNKIKTYTIDQRIVKLAKEVGGSNQVFPALSLIDYDPELEPVMKFIFGGTFVCTDMNVAKKVTYHQGIMHRSVTLEGDTLDPEGSLSGGAANKGGSILLQLAEITRSEQMFHAKQQELTEIDGQIRQIRGVAQKYQSVKDQIDVLTNRQKAVQIALGNTTFEQNQAEVIGFEHEIETLQGQLVTSTKTRDEATKKTKEIESKIAESKQGREQKLKSAEDQVKKAKKKLEEDKKKWKTKKAEFDVMKAEVDDLAEAIKKAETDREAIQKNIEEQEEKLKEIEDGVKGGSERVSEMKRNIQQKRDELKQKNKELSTRHKKKDEQADLIQDLTLAIKKSEIEVNKIKNENAESETQINTLERNHPWIKEEREHFGKRNTQFDYTKEDPEAAYRKLNALMSDQKRISLNLNQNVLHLLKQEEEQHEKVMQRIAEIETDKSAIQEFLEKTEREKLIQVEQACKEVNKNFSEIFTTILPGVQAMLRTVDGDFKKGMDIRVGFNGIWKDSLSELSGGQRSLVALSLILAMLKYNPAPIYILDEVDAALDLSHTQNIGKMLKIHFKDSQFIIVSLKDGMFNNANVLFRTQLTEGISGITRTANKNHN